MKRSIEEAAYDYATEKTKFRKDVLKEVDADNYVLRHADCMEDFQCGVKWQAKQSPWINVEEPVPEEGQMVFALTQREGIFYIHQETFYRAKYLDGYGKWIHGNSRVLAWMPIPSFDEILEANKDVLQRIKGNGD